MGCSDRAWPTVGLDGDNDLPDTLTEKSVATAVDRHRYISTRSSVLFTTNYILGRDIDTCRKLLIRLAH